MPAGHDSLSVLTVAEMGRADAAAIQRGIAGERLMEAAGRAVADEVQRRFPKGRVVVLCGPGNNGGDGFVAARRLASAGRTVRLALLGSREALKGDAALQATRWTNAVEALSPDLLEEDDIVIDALFGAGLSRPLDGMARAAVTAINKRGLRCIGVDVPSGVSGNTGDVSGDAPRCAATVTFFRKKPAHLLLPGRLLCGETLVADIGIPADVLDTIRPSIAENGPALWGERYPWPQPDGHKYSRGHAVVVGGVSMTGAGRLSARAALRAGAGLVTVAAPQAAHPVFATAAASLILAATDEPQAFATLLTDNRKNAVLLGPGNGVGVPTRLNVLATLQAHKACVLDADALTSFADDPAHLCRAIGRAGTPILLTPHDGELNQLFPDIVAQHKADKVARARAAAERSGAVVLLKGFDTVIAAPDGRVVINANAPAHLATAGAGDVLAGFAIALMAQGLDAFDAGCAAAWLHGDAATRFGLGLIADDLIEALPATLQALRARGFTGGEN